MAVKLAEGVKAPAFKLPTDDGGSVTLADFKGKSLVLFFYPKADTPGCTREAIAFSALKGAFTKANTAVVGVSADNVLITSGSQQALDLIGRVFLNPGDHVLVERPTYLGALQAWSAYQAEYLTVGIDHDGMRIEELAGGAARRSQVYLRTAQLPESERGNTVT